VTIRPPKLDIGKSIKTHESPPENTDNLVPLYSLEYMVSGYCVESCQEAQRAHFAMALFKRRRMTWRELRVAPRHGLGSEKIARTSIRVTLPSMVTEDVDILAFRCIGTAPMVGFRSGRTFNILWIDKNYEVYDHGS
jgi:hypothetical protein